MSYNKILWIKFQLPSSLSNLVIGPNMRSLIKQERCQWHFSRCVPSSSLGAARLSQAVVQAAKENCRASDDLTYLMLYARLLALIHARLQEVITMQVPALVTEQHRSLLSIAVFVRESPTGMQVLAQKYSTLSSAQVCERCLCHLSGCLVMPCRHRQLV